MLKRLTITLGVLGLWGACVSSQALDWRLVGTSNKVNVYIDHDSIKTKQDSVRVYGSRDVEESTINLWVMFDQLAEPSYKSFKAQLLIDCNRATVSYLATAMYSGLNGNGELVKSNSTPSPVKPIIPGSMDAKIFEASCDQIL